MKLHAQEHAHSPQRCPFCHDALRESDPTVRCSKCETAYHEACTRELQRCAVMGCDAELRRPLGAAARPVVDEVPDTTLSTIQRTIALIAVVPLGALSVLAVIAGANAHAESAIYAGVVGGVVLGSLALVSFLTIFDPSLVMGPTATRVLRALFGSPTARWRALGVMIGVVFLGLAGLGLHAVGLGDRDRELQVGIGASSVVLGLLSLLAFGKAFSSSARR